MNLPEGSTGSWHEPCLGLLLGDLCLNPVSLLWSHLCRSSSATRSTVMKRTCRKSLQPSKVSQGSQPNSPQRAGCSLSPWHMAPQDWAAALIQPECSTCHWALRQRSPPQRVKSRPFPLPVSLWICCRLALALPLCPMAAQCGSGWLPFSPSRPCALPGPQHTICPL